MASPTGDEERGESTDGSEESTIELDSTPDASAAEAMSCPACVIVNRTPELQDDEWLDEDLAAASVLDFRQLDQVVEVPLTPPGHVVRAIEWGPKRGWIVALHEERIGTVHLSVYDASEGFASRSFLLPRESGTYGIRRLASAEDDWSSLLSYSDEAGLVSYYAYALDPASNADSSAEVIIEAADKMAAWPMPQGHGVLFQSPLPGGNNFECQWHHWDNTVPATLRHLYDSSCADAAPRFSADGSVFSTIAADPSSSQREQALIYDSATLERVMELPSADFVRLTFGPEGSRFAYELSYYSLVGDVSVSDDHLYLGEVSNGWTADSVWWGRTPLGDAPIRQIPPLRLSLFADSQTILVLYDEPYLVSFEGGPWRGLGTPHADYHPFVSGGRLGYTTDDGVYLMDTDFVAGSRRISHAFESESTFGAPVRIPGGFAYQTYWRLEDDTIEYCRRFVLDGESPVALDEFEERSNYSVVVPLEGSAGSLLHARGGNDLGQLYHLSERLETTLLATNVATFR